jgi:hypothetical protein
MEMNRHRQRAPVEALGAATWTGRFLRTLGVRRAAGHAEGSGAGRATSSTPMRPG